MHFDENERSEMKECNALLKIKDYLLYIFLGFSFSLFFLEKKNQEKKGLISILNVQLRIRNVYSRYLPNSKHIRIEITKSRLPCASTMLLLQNQNGDFL